MTIIKREIDLPETLGVYLAYTPSSTETHAFYADLRTMSHTLLRDAILECANSKKQPAAGQTKRHLIHSVYTRKIKELAALYPFLFATENALRAWAAETYLHAFKDAYWWRKITKAAAEGKTAANFTLQADNKKRIGLTPVNPQFVEVCFFAVSKFAKSQVDRLAEANCYATRFYEEITIKNLSDLIQADFLLCPVGSLKKTDFQRHMKTICDARNELFHGRPIKNRATLSNACEQILDAIAFHLGDFDDALRETKYTRTAMQIPRAPRHLTPPKIT